MANGTYLEIECIRGSTFLLEFELSENGMPVDLSDYVGYFTIVQNIGDVPTIDCSTVNTTDAFVYINGLLGAGGVRLEYWKTKFKFSQGQYSLILLSPSPDNNANYLLYGPIKIVTTAKQLPDPVVP